MVFTQYDMLVAPYEIADPGDGGRIIIDRMFGLCEISTSTTETRDVAPPDAPGLIATIRMMVDGGNCALGFESPINAAGNVTVTLNDVDDIFQIMSMADNLGSNTYRWQITVNSGCSLSS